MKVTTYLPYFDYNDSNFDIQNSTVNGQDYADMLEKEGRQSCEALFHNLNTLNCFGGV